MHIDGLSGALTAPHKAKYTEPSKAPETQSPAPPVSVVAQARVTDAGIRASINRDLPEPSQNKALNAYNEIAIAEKKDNLTALLGIDVYA
ncbi:hypothetical protein DRW07_17325 [Alteromonas sediminis]|uniref:Chromosome partitioning protein ParA n=1 Tax=Alteromonas sediminis TaxID=2259342 RepID=A0A3N5XYN2_9ALTE|nr:hypothetical protein [Alteromonas sediminis]RPJ65076.1 hypothetical protein DRW07_17325 [Alteromonas sediminis]